MDTRQAEIGDKIHFAVMAIEASAKEMSISPMEMRRRLKRSDWCVVIFYDMRTYSMLHDSKYGLHLMSDDYILNDLLRELGDRQ